MSGSRYMSHRGGGHAHMSPPTPSSRSSSLTSPVLSNSSFGSLDYFASPFEGIVPPRNSPIKSSTYATFSDSPSMTWPVPHPHPHLGSYIRRTDSPTPTTSTRSSTSTIGGDLRAVGLAALTLPVSPDPNVTPPNSATASFDSPGPSPSRFRPTPDMRKKLAIHRRTVLFPEAGVVNWARPFRAQGHSHQSIEDAADLLPSPQFDLEDLCEEAFQIKAADTALFGASAQRQRRLRTVSPSLSPASTESSAGPLTPDATPPMFDQDATEMRDDGTWQVGPEGKGLGIDKVQHGLHRLSWHDTSKSVSPIISTPTEHSDVEEILLNDDLELPDQGRASFVATASVLDGYYDDSHDSIRSSSSEVTVDPTGIDAKVKQSSSEGTMPFEYSSLLSSSSMASLSSVPTTVSELQEMRQAAEDLMNSLRSTQSTAIARVRASSDMASSPARPRSRVNSTSRIRRKAVPSIDIEQEEGEQEQDSLSSGQSTPSFEQDLARTSSPSPAIRKGFYALRAAAQSVPTFLLNKPSSPPSPTTSTSSASTTQLRTPTTPTFPVDSSRASVEIKRVPFQIHPDSCADPRVRASSGGYMTRSQALAAQEQEQRSKDEAREAKTRRGLARFFKSDR